MIKPQGLDDFLQRMRSKPSLSAELGAATLVVNLLALADTIYVMIVLRRYIAYGFDGTLIILTLGTLVAIALQWGLLRARGTLASGVDDGETEALGNKVFSAMTSADAKSFDASCKQRLQEVNSDLGELQNAYGSGNVTALLDAPFALMFTAAVAFLSPLLAALVLVGVVCTVWAGFAGVDKRRSEAKDLSQAMGKTRGLLGSTVHAADPVRAFRGALSYRQLFVDSLSALGAQRRLSEGSKSRAQSLSAGIGVCVRVGIYAVGAKLAAEGQLTVAALIGASILGSYAVAKAAGCVRAGLMLAAAAQAQSRLDAILDMPAEVGGDRSITEYKGGFVLKDVAFGFDPQHILFSDLSLELKPGRVLAIMGYNGSGKSTLLRLLMGLISPTSGSVLVDGVPVGELDLVWWRRQVMYLPQEPYFLAGTLLDNITMGVPALGGEELIQVVRSARLNHFLDTSEQGIATPVTDAGRTLPVGIRKRLGLARALAVQGRVALLDEPTAGMDADGIKAVYEVMNDMAQKGVTIVVVTDDPGIIKGAHHVLDLTTKPKPTLQHRATKLAEDES